MSEIVQQNESLTPGSVVELFQIDLNPVGVDQVFYFQQADAKGGVVYFGGEQYVPLPITVTGFTRKANEAPPQPTLTIGNVDKGGYQLLNDYNDLLGAKLTRIRTYAEFLDYMPDGITPNPNADGSAQMIPEVWYVEQKQTATRVQIEFALKSIMDMQGKQFPARLLLKKVCLRRYRVWNPKTGTFKYATVNACPYAGTHYFQRNGAPTSNPALDACGKDPGSCALRFTSPLTHMPEDLPGWFFPGVRRIPGNAG